MDAIRLVEAGHLKKDRQGFAPGDNVRVHVRVIEGEKERTQIFEGVVIRKRGEGGRASFTVRRISYGVGVERTFPLHSPRIDRIDVVRHGKVRRSKLYYLRTLAGKAARLKEKRAAAVPTTAAFCLSRSAAFTPVTASATAASTYSGSRAPGFDRTSSIAASKYRRSSLAYQGPSAGLAMTSRTVVTEGRRCPSIS